MRFHCPTCKKTIEDAVIMHYVLRHPLELEKKASKSQIQEMLDQHFGVKKKQRTLLETGVDLIDSLLTEVALLCKFVTK